jgi:hypothetical protein
MQTYVDPNQFLLNSEGTSVALMNYYDTGSCLVTNNLRNPMDFSG